MQLKDNFKELSYSFCTSNLQSKNTNFGMGSDFQLKIMHIKWVMKFFSFIFTTISDFRHWYKMSKKKWEAAILSKKKREEQEQE